MPEQETIELDPAVQYATAHGVIRASNQSEEWLEALRADVNQFLFTLSNATGLGYSEYALNFKSNVSANFSLLFEITDTRSNVYATWSGGSRYRIMEILLVRKNPIYWVIYSGTDGVGVSFASADTVQLPESVQDYTPPSEAIWNTTILNVMAMKCPFSFAIVPVLDSITNKDGYSGLVILPQANSSNLITWTADNENPFGKNISASSCNRLFTYGGANMPMGPGGSMLLCGDSIYYPPLGQNDMVTNPVGSIHSNIAATVYLTPLTAPNTRCITTTSKTAMWGGELDPDGLEPGVAHTGPIANQGTSGRTWLQCYNFYLPVSTPQENND